MRITGWLLLAAFCTPARADEIAVHQFDDAAWVQQPTPPESIDQRLEQAATQYAPHAPVPRIALFDIAFPASAEEYRATGGVAVVWVTALSQDTQELPPKRVYAVTHGMREALAPIHAMSLSHPRNEEVARVLGTSRWDGLYLFPLRLLEAGTTLTMDFATHRDGFELGRLSAEDGERLGYPLAPIPGKPGKPATRQHILDLIAREYPGLMTRPASSRGPQDAAKPAATDASGAR
jgi:hypothetical protein